MNIRPVRLTDIDLLNADLQRMVDWYRTVLVAQVVNRSAIAATASGSFWLFRRHRVVPSFTRK